MQVVIYNPTQKFVNPLCKLLQQNRLRVEVARQKEHCLSLMMSDLYTALIYIYGDSQDHLRSFYQEWKNEGCQSLFIVVTSRQSLIERAQSLALGIDCYYIEPYSYLQLLTEVLIYEHCRPVEKTHHLKTPYFEIDFLSKMVWVNGVLLVLTRIEFDLLSLFIRKIGVILSRAQIWEEVWGYQNYPLANTVDVHINRLRKKLSSHEEVVIKTVYGIGYQMIASTEKSG